jgi:Flp pilus assembly protein TadD
MGNYEWADLHRSGATLRREKIAESFMKKIVVLSFSILISAGCGAATNQQTTNVSTQNSTNSMTVSSHSSETSPTAANQVVVPKSETKTKWTQSGNPIDTSEFDAEIAKAEKSLKAKPKDAGAKKALAEAYVARGVALTEARQYASALGDYRRTLKFEPDNAEAKNGMDEIIRIYESLNREYPKDGEEPPPLPFTKKT